MRQRYKVKIIKKVTVANEEQVAACPSGVLGKDPEEKTGLLTTSKASTSIISKHPVVAEKMHQTHGELNATMNPKPLIQSIILLKSH
jgi:hypothetical protein